MLCYNFVTLDCFLCYVTILSHYIASCAMLQFCHITLPPVLCYNFVHKYRSQYLWMIVHKYRSQYLWMIVHKYRSQYLWKIVHKYWPQFLWKILHKYRPSKLDHGFSMLLKIASFKKWKVRTCLGKQWGHCSFEFMGGLTWPVAGANNVGLTILV